MENVDQNSNELNDPGNRKRTTKIAVIVILFALPLGYLFIKAKGPAESTAVESKVPAAAVDLEGMEKAVAENPSFENLVNLSMAYINNKMPGRSIDYLKQAIALNPKSAIAYNNLGVAYILLQQYQNGLDACNKALEIDPTFQLAKNNIAWGMDEKSKVVTAIKAQETLPENKRDIAFYSDYGLNYFKIGDYTKSIEIWNKIFDLDPKNTGALNSIGTAFMMKGQIDDAIVLFKKASEIEPANQIAKNNLNWALSEKAKKK